MKDVLAELPENIIERHKKLNTILNRIEEQNIGYLDRLESRLKILVGAATQEDHENLQYYRLVEEYNNNRARLNVPNPLAGKKSRVMVKLLGIMTPDGKYSDEIDKVHTQNLQDKGYTLYVSRIPAGSTEGVMITRGLPEIWNHLDLMVLEPQNLSLHEIVLEDLIDRIKAGRVFEDGDLIEDVLEGRFGFTVKLFRKKCQDMECFQVSYFDSKGEKTVKLAAPQEFLDAIQKLNLNPEPSAKPINYKWKGKD